MTLLLALAVTVFALGLGFAIFRRLSRYGLVSTRAVAFTSGAGAFVGALVATIERAVLDWTGLDFEVRVAGAGGALMAAFLLAAPLEEAAKLVVVWPLYKSRHLDRPRLGICYTALAASAFAAAEGAFAVLREPSGLVALRALLGAVAHVFFAGVWGYALGASRTRPSWFSLAWLSSMLLHGLFAHIVWGRGPGYLTATLPMLAVMGVGAYFVLRKAGPEPDRPSLLPAPPTFSEVREAFRPAERPIMLRWVAAGAFVTLGLIIVLALASVLLGRRLGIDFSLADETDLRSAGPLLVIGVGVVLAFPLAGYLVARASSALTVLESALATLLAMAILIVLFALTAPVAVLFAVALVPIAVALACGGAWIGLER
ncbi:MAG TPA: PrsW family glutamic-type intramembrane protease [Polyangiaceae bacterium]|nr:PrsW family glutamic-type intramembrane protease [Polyangiaceae bacterium]